MKFQDIKFTFGQMKIMSLYMFIFRKENQHHKVWLTKSGCCILANNNSRIPNKDLSEIMRTIASNHFFIVAKWKEIYRIENVRFYC